MQDTPFHTRILELCEELLACESEQRQVELAREMRTLVHERVEQIRGHLIILPMLDESADPKRPA